MVVLRVLTPYSADFDGDRDVDADDLTGSGGGWQTRYDDDLHGNDFLAWQRQLGSGVDAFVGSHAVPEPTVLILTLPALLAVSVRRFK